MDASAAIFYGVRLIRSASVPWGSNNIEPWWEAIAKDEIDFEIDAAPHLKKHAPERLLADWLRENPLPVSIMNAIHGNALHRFIAVPETVTTAQDGLVSFAPQALEVPKGRAAELMRFCKAYHLRVDGRPQWWLIG